MTTIIIFTLNLDILTVTGKNLLYASRFVNNNFRLFSNGKRALHTQLYSVFVLFLFSFTFQREISNGKLSSAFAREILYIHTYYVHAYV